MQQPGPVRAGMQVELVANPIPKQTASGLLTNLATVLSNSLCKSVIPVKKQLSVKFHSFISLHSLSSGLFPNLGVGEVITGSLF